MNLKVARQLALEQWRERGEPTMKMRITANKFDTAIKALAEGTAIIVAHGIGWQDDEWERAFELKAIHGAFWARFIPSGKWTEIDGLDVRANESTRSEVANDSRRT